MLTTIDMIWHSNCCFYQTYWHIESPITPRPPIGKLRERQPGCQGIKHFKLGLLVWSTLSNYIIKKGK